jgi:hypothetical protein
MPPAAEREDDPRVIALSLRDPSPKIEMSRHTKSAELCWKA